MLRRILIALISVVALNAQAEAQAQPLLRPQPSEFFDDLYRADYRPLPSWLCTVSPRTTPPPEQPTWTFEEDDRGISCKLAPAERYFKHDVTEVGSTYRVAVMTTTSGPAAARVRRTDWWSFDLRNLLVEADLDAVFWVNDGRSSVDISEVRDVSLNFWVLLKDPGADRLSSYVLTRQPLKLVRGAMTHVSVRVSTDMNDWTCVNPRASESGCLEQPEFERALGSFAQAFGFVLFARGKTERDPRGFLTIARARIRTPAQAGAPSPPR